VVLYNVTSLYKVFAIFDFRTTVVTVEVTDIYYLVVMIKILYSSSLVRYKRILFFVQY
jgi:hypothetical protein